MSTWQYVDRHDKRVYITCKKACYVRCKLTLEQRHRRTTHYILCQRLSGWCRVRQLECSAKTQRYQTASESQRPYHAGRISSTTRPASCKCVSGATGIPTAKHSCNYGNTSERLTDIHTCLSVVELCSRSYTVIQNMKIVKNMFVRLMRF